MELDKKIIRLSVSDVLGKSSCQLVLASKKMREAADKQIIEDCYSKIFDNQEDGKRIAGLCEAHQINELVGRRYMLSRCVLGLQETPEYAITMLGIIVKLNSLEGKLEDGIYSFTDLLKKLEKEIDEYSLKGILECIDNSQLVHVKLGFFSFWSHSHYNGVNTVLTKDTDGKSAKCYSDSIIDNIQLCAKLFLTEEDRIKIDSLSNFPTLDISVRSPSTLTEKVAASWLNHCHPLNADSKMASSLDEYRRKTGLSTCEEMKERLRSIGIPEKDLKGIPDVGYMWPKSIEDDGEVTITPSLEMSINWANEVKEMESTMIKNEEYKPKNQMLVPVYCFDNSDGNIVLVTGSSVVVTKRIVGSLANVDYDELLEAAKNTAIESMLSFDVACTDAIGYFIQTFVPYVDAVKKVKTDFVTNDSVRDNPLNSVINIQMDIPEPLENYLIGTRFPHMFTGLPFVGRDMK